MPISIPTTSFQQHNPALELQGHSQEKDISNIFYTPFDTSVQTKNLNTPFQLFQYQILRKCPTSQTRPPGMTERGPLVMSEKSTRPLRRHIKTSNWPFGRGGR